MHRNYFSVGENEGNIPEIASVIEVSVLEAESLNALPTTETDLNTSWSFLGSWHLAIIGINLLPHKEIFVPLESQIDGNGVRQPTRCAGL